MAYNKKKKSTEVVEEPKVVEAVHKPQLSEQEIYDKAFDDVCKKLGTSREQLDKIQAAKKPAVKNVYYEIPFECKINGKTYPLKGVETREVVDMLTSMAGAKRQRLIKEKISHKFEVQMLSGGTITSKLIGAEDAAGTEVSSI